MQGRKHRFLQSIVSFSFLQVHNACPNGLSIADAVLTIPSSTTLIRPRKAPHTLLGHCRPPDHERTPQSESWRVGITAISPLVSYCPCVCYSFVPLSLPRPLNSSSARIYSIFCLANCPRSLLRSWFHDTNASRTSMIVPSF